MSLIAASPLTAFEQERLDRIAENRRRMGKSSFLARRLSDHLPQSLIIRIVVHCRGNGGFGHSKGPAQVIPASKAPHPEAHSAQGARPAAFRMQINASKVPIIEYKCFEPQERKPKRHQPVRRSRRLTGAGAEFGSQEDSNDECVTYSDLEPGLDDILAGARGSNRPTEQKTVAPA